MTWEIQLTDSAWEDVFHAVKWYDEQKHGLGDTFIELMDKTIKSISENPDAYKKVYRQVRQASLQKFPYVVLYKVEKSKVVVYSVFHTSQNPKKKIKRLKR